MMSQQLRVYQCWARRCCPDQLWIHRALFSFYKDKKYPNVANGPQTTFEGLDIVQLNSDISTLKEVIEKMANDRWMGMARKTVGYVLKSYMWRMDLRRSFNAREEKVDVEGVGPEKSSPAL